MTRFINLGPEEDEDDDLADQDDGDEDDGDEDNVDDGLEL